MFGNAERRCLLGKNETYFQRNSLYVKRKDTDGFLYIYMYLADTNGPCIRGMYIGEKTYTVDLRKALPSYFLRPAAQHGWVVRNHKRVECDYDDNVVCVAKILISDAAKWLGDSAFSLILRNCNLAK